MTMTLYAKIDSKKAKKIKKKIILQNANICIDIKIKSIFWLAILKKDKHIFLLVIKINNIKIANILREKKLVLGHILHKYIRYNLICKIKQCFNYSKYDHSSVYYQKNIKCEACLGPFKTFK